MSPTSSPSEGPGPSRPGPSAIQFKLYGVFLLEPSEYGEGWEYEVLTYAEVDPGFGEVSASHALSVFAHKERAEAHADYLRGHFPKATYVVKIVYVQHG
jgi:hypothetical protein